MGHIRGKMRKKVWMTAGDIVLVALREYERDKCDIILKYTQDEIMKLKAKKEIPDNLKVNEESESRNKDTDNMIEFEKNTDKEQDNAVEDDDEMYMSDDEEEESEDDSEDEKEEKKEVKKDTKKEEKKEEKKSHGKEDDKKVASDEDTEDISKVEQNDDFLNDFCKEQKKTPAILTKTSHTAKSNVKIIPTTQNSYNKPSQGYGNKNQGKKKFVEIDLKKI
jgi:hypothetical protein